MTYVWVGAATAWICPGGAVVQKLEARMTHSFGRHESAGSETGYQL